MNINLKFEPVICVTGGKGFEEGFVYPLIGWNNGVHIIRESKQGDAIDECFMTGGIGKGMFNSWDEDGIPSFNPLFR